MYSDPGLNQNQKVPLRAIDEADVIIFGPGSSIQVSFKSVDW